ncbi:hypothetical protein [Thalassotalea marina]|uniref:Lipoprotein n=1 Tax=Thalassotalea marina TaxID=1673741 RepID=A0A919BFJ8_9GAMM|nr:hypothetical protein [Thalassotalea marina]GHF88812.1 hypothetical protein GCM10017161_15700 [Thalassotalea marina]
MRKQKLIILACVVNILLIGGCGMPGPLYQETDEKAEQSQNSSPQDTKQQEQ